MALFVVLIWMMVVAPLGQIRALLRRWESAHVPIAVKPGGYDTVVQDLAGALDRALLPERRGPLNNTWAALSSSYEARSTWNEAL